MNLSQVEEPTNVPSGSLEYTKESKVSGEKDSNNTESFGANLHKLLVFMVFCINIKPIARAIGMKVILFIKCIFIIFGYNV